MLLKKIVIAEDDDAIAHMVNMALGDAGFLCLRARTGEEALNLVRVQSPDLLVLDLMMPQIDGIEVCKRLRADVLTSKTPILMLTALTSVDSKIEGLEAGADDYVTKPFDLRELAARCKALIRSSRRERERSPTTDLPGSTAISDHLQGVLHAGEPRAVLHVQVDGFRAFADDVGYAQSEELARHLGGAVLSSARESSSAGEPFVGHLGGVDFIVVCDPAAAEGLAADLIATFDDRRADWTGRRPAAEGMRIAAAIVPTEGLGANASDELTRRLASTLRACKQRDGSNYLAWTPELA
jgi:PleD family two-component response regulator